MFIYIPRELPPKVVETGEKVIKAFDLRERFFHIRTPDLVKGHAIKQAIMETT